MAAYSYNIRDREERTMKIKTTPNCRSMRVGLGFWFVCVLFFLPLQAAAENIEVDPVEGDFGTAWVDASKEMVFTLESMGPTPLAIYSVHIMDDPTSSFSITDITPPIPPELDPGETVDVEVAFSPTAEGIQTGNMTLISNDRETPVVHVPLTGNGAEAWGAASTLGKGPSAVSSGANVFLALLVPAEVLFAWRRARKKR